MVCHLFSTKPLSCYRNQCPLIVDWTLRNKLQWNFNKYSYFFVQENAFENVICEKAAILSQPQCVKEQHLEMTRAHTGSHFYCDFSEWKPLDFHSEKSNKNVDNLAAARGNVWRGGGCLSKAHMCKRLTRVNTASQTIPAHTTYWTNTAAQQTANK